MRFDIITIFPQMLGSYLGESLLGRAQKNKLISITMHNLRDGAKDKRLTVDDAPYGGGPGMVMMIEPIAKTLKKIKRRKKSKVILLDPAGKQFSQKIAADLSKLDQLIFICGRYEGIDARVDKLADEKISIGPYVLSGGELGAGVMLEAVARLIPGVLGNKQSLNEETFNYRPSKIGNKKSKVDTEYPQYTRPKIFIHTHGSKKKKLHVPKVLLNGNHKEINKWRQKHSK